MATATWNGTVIAKSDQTIVIEGNHYFPPDTVRWDLLQESSTHTTCPWKGKAGYYNVVIDGKTNRDAAWTYPTPKAAAAEITGYLAFWRGVSVSR